jgi:CBS domain-containing protein
MAMKVSDIVDVTRGLVGTVAPDSPISAVTTLMAEQHVGVVAVVDAAGHMAGIVSERDVAQGLHESGAAVLDQPVSGLMTAKVIGCMPETDVRDAAELMIQHRIRHLPVLDGDRPLTIVSMRDIVATRLATLEADNEVLRAQLQEISAGGG